MSQTNISRTEGFEEVEHTADWAYRIWGQNLEELFIQAAIGLYTLAGVQLAEKPHLVREIELKGIDRESLLVAWLNELLYLHESENLAFSEFEILQLDSQNLRMRMRGAATRQWDKYIKAVTYNNLAIIQGDRGLEATLVMDV
jgi:SHS2 domain-containing protein